MQGKGSEATGRVRLDSLSSLRFAAAVLVLVVHSSGLFLASVRFNDGYGRGNIAVAFFFLLSGFVLTWSRSTPLVPRQFLAHRFARIGPLQAATWLFVLLVYAAQSIHTGAGPALTNLLLVQAWVPKATYVYSLNGPSWTLSCDVFFYLMFPVSISLLSRCSNRQLRRLTIGILVALLAVSLLGFAAIRAAGHLTAAEYFVFNFPPVRLAEFLLGILLALAMERGWRPRVSVGPALLIALVPNTLIAVLFGSGGLTIPLVLFGPVPGLMLLIGAAASADLRGRSRLLAHPWLVRMGKWSFAAYLLQGPVFAVLLWAGVKATTNVVDELAFLVGVIALSGVVFEIFERPVERYLRARLAPNSAPSVTTESTAVA